MECNSTQEQVEEIQATGELVYECGGLPILINAFATILEVIQKS